ncbi:nucleotide-diphospho-sugar transferase [Aspergillus varians]
MSTTSPYYPSRRFIRALLIATYGLISICAILNHGPNFSTITSPSPNPHLRPPPKYAFATILTGEGDPESNLENPYFVAARLLTYQLLHSPETSSAGNIPLLVLVTDNIPQEQRSILASDGATIVPVQRITREWVHPKWARWEGVLAKLNAWRMIEYDKIVFLDADSILFKAIDGIFTDPATDSQQTKQKGDRDEDVDSTTSSLPDTYLTAGTHDTWVEANLPPQPGKGTDFYVRDNYMNAGFFVFAPSEEVFQYYVSLLDKPGAFEANYPEQNLLNYAHRVDGRMPWRDIGVQWSQKGASRAQYEGGLKSVHQKWWIAMHDEVLDGYVENVMAEMRAFVAERRALIGL